MNQTKTLNQNMIFRYFLATAIIASLLILLLLTASFYLGNINAFSFNLSQLPFQLNGLIDITILHYPSLRWTYLFSSFTVVGFLFLVYVAYNRSFTFSKPKVFLIVLLLSIVGFTVLYKAYYKGFQEGTIQKENLIKNTLPNCKDNLNCKMANKILNAFSVGENTYYGFIVGSLPNHLAIYTREKGALIIPRQDVHLIKPIGGVDLKRDENVR